MDECTDKKLEEFGLKNYTYINQIFGDETVREIITEIFPNKKYKLSVEKWFANNGEESFHHYLIGKNNTRICSVDNGYQNLNQNKNDTLCQSYSLLTYFNKPINQDQKERQMDMIDMYRNILSNKDFLKMLDEEILKNKDNNKLWIDYTSDDKYVKMNLQHILKSINKVLNEWEEYGYYYYIGNGKCPKQKKHLLQYHHEKLELV